VNKIHLEVNGSETEQSREKYIKLKESHFPISKLNTKLIKTLVANPALPLPKKKKKNFSEEPGSKSS
jgi:hypothetical protein